MRLFVIRSKDKSQQRGAFKNIAEYLGVHATLISQILSGTKDFSEEQIFSVCEYLGVAKLETHYLWILLQFERAGSLKLKIHYQQLKQELRKDSLQMSNRIQKKHELTETEKAVFYSSWVYSEIQVATTLNTKVDFKFLCEKFNLGQSRTREILDFLTQIKMIIESGGIFKPGTTATHLEKKSPFITKHHSNWRLKAM